MVAGGSLCGWGRYSFFPFSDLTQISVVRKQYHSNKNDIYCGLMTDLGLIPFFFLINFAFVPFICYLCAWI